MPSSKYLSTLDASIKYFSTDIILKVLYCEHKYINRKIKPTKNNQTKNPLHQLNSDQ